MDQQGMSATEMSGHANEIFLDSENIGHAWPLISGLQLDSCCKHIYGSHGVGKGSWKNRGVGKFNTSLKLASLRESLEMKIFWKWKIWVKFEIFNDVFQLQWNFLSVRTFSASFFSISKFSKLKLSNFSIFPTAFSNYSRCKLFIWFDKLLDPDLVGLRLYSEIYQNFRILEKFLIHRVRHQK